MLLVFLAWSLAWSLACSGTFVGGPDIRMSASAADSVHADASDQRPDECRKRHIGPAIAALATTATPSHPPSLACVPLSPPIRLAALQPSPHHTRLSADRGPPQPLGPPVAHFVWPNAPPA